MNVTLTQLLAAVNKVKLVKKQYDSSISERNELIHQFLKENNNSDVVYNLAYELKLTPATIYNIKAKMDPKKEVAK